MTSKSLPLDRAVETEFKRFLKERLGIAPDGLAIAAPLWCSWTNFGHRITDAIVREQAVIAARCGFKTMQLDDGWQNDLLGIEPDPETFPDFGSTGEFVRSQGLGLGLWVSCFRSDDAPDFLALPGAASRPVVRRLGGKAIPPNFTRVFSPLANIRRYRKRFDTLRRLEEDYGIYRNFQYSGVPAPTDTDWHWWGKLNGQGHGAVVVMRGRDGEDQRAIKIPWVRPAG